MILHRWRASTCSSASARSAAGLPKTSSAGSPDAPRTWPTAPADHATLRDTNARGEAVDGPGRLVSRFHRKLVCVLSTGPPAARTETRERSDRTPRSDTPNITLSDMQRGGRSEALVGAARP